MRKLLLVICIAVLAVSCTDPLDIDDNIGKYNISTNVDETDDLNGVTWDGGVILHLAVGNTWEYQYIEHIGIERDTNNQFMKIIDKKIIGSDTSYILNNNNKKIIGLINYDDGLYGLDNILLNTGSSPKLKYKYPIRKNDKYFIGDTAVILIDTKNLVELDFGAFRCYVYRMEYEDLYISEIYMMPGLGVVKEVVSKKNESDNTSVVQNEKILTAFYINSDSTIIN